MSVLIVGGGWSGLAAGVELTRHGVPVTLLEASRQLGGRARAVRFGDSRIDNGQHILLGAYQSVLDLLAKLGMGPITTGAVCVYHEMIPAAKAALSGTNIPIAAVSTGFPAGLSPLELRIKEIEMSVAAGASEIDIVISRRHVLSGDWQALYDEMQAFRVACGDAHVKAILATGELGSLRNVARASLVCMMAGADFIKTSTGKETVNATLPVSLVMIRAIRDYYDRTGLRVGYKPAGGISKAKDAITYLALMKEELGDRWLQPDLFRFGASSLLNDIERQLEHHITGNYSAGYRHATS